MERIVPSAANLRFLSFLAARSFRNLKFKSRTGIIELLVPLCFRSSCPGLLRCITNFGSGALGGQLRCLNARYDARIGSQLKKTTCVGGQGWREMNVHCELRTRL